MLGGGSWWEIGKLGLGFVVILGGNIFIGACFLDPFFFFFAFFSRILLFGRVAIFGRTGNGQR